MDATSTVAAIAGAAVAVTTAIIGYLSLRYKASAGSVDDLKERLEAAGRREGLLKSEHEERITRMEQRMTEMEELEKECRKRVALLIRQQTEQRLKEADIIVQVRTLENEVARLRREFECNGNGGKGAS